LLPCRPAADEARPPRVVGQKEQVEALIQQRPINDTSAGLGPRAALQRVGLRNMDATEKAAWLEESRLDAILGNCRLSIPSVLSGVRCYIAFAGQSACMRALAMAVALLVFSDAAGPGGSRYFPPDPGLLLAWSALFRSAGTWNNYLNYVKTACLLIGAPTQVCFSVCDGSIPVASACRLAEVFEGKALERARGSITKARNFCPRAKMWIQRCVCCTWV
jgi:hypothetical protein